MKKCNIIAICNQKGGVAKTTTALNLGVGLAGEGKKVLLIDCDPQGDLTVSLGIKNPDELEVTLSDLMMKVLKDKPVTPSEGIISHKEGVDLIPSNLELSSMEIQLVNAMSREVTLKNYIKEAKLKEAEASQIVADVGAMNMTPEQLGEFLALIQSGGLHELLSGKTKAATTEEGSNETEDNKENLYEEEEDVNDED